MLILPVTLMIMSLFYINQEVNAQNITATQTGMLDFVESMKLTEDERTGKVDITEKLQSAVNQARDGFRTLFIPSGTYLVSKPIDCIAKNNSSHRGEGAVIIVGSQKERPLIRLKNNSPDFQGTGQPSQTTGPRPVFGLRNVDFPSKNSDWNFYSGIRSLNIDLGMGNPGAIGVSWASAQNCFLEEITVFARDGFAGVAGLPGANALTVNVDVHGGRYGFFLTRNEDNKTLWAQASVTTIVGCRLFDQKENALRLFGWGGVTLTGIQIEKKNGTAIWLSGSSNPNSCPLVITDSRVEFSEENIANRAIDNSGKSTTGLLNMFTLRANTICFNNSGNLVPETNNEWTRVVRYHYIDKNPKTLSSLNVSGNHHVQGILTSEDILEMEKQMPPADLISRHVWPFTPSFEDDGVVLVDNSGTNHREKIQEAIDNNSKVMLARGSYTLDGPIVLRDSTVLFGSPGMRVILRSSSSWVPAGHVWLIDTDDNPNASTYLMEVSTDPLKEHYWGSIRWRAGRNSIVRDVACGRTSGGHERNIKRVYITGSGGGRWYNYNDHKNLWDNPEVDENHRKVLIEGTSEPITFYGLNLERGGGFKGVVSSFPMCEIRDASNVRILGGKTETFQPYAWIENCNNVSLFNIHDWCIHNKNNSGQHYIEIKGIESNNIEVVNSQWNLPPDTTFRIVSDPWSSNTPHRKMHMGLYQKGLVDYEVFVMEGKIQEIDEIPEIPVNSSIYTHTGTHSLSIYPNPSFDGRISIDSNQTIGQVMVMDASGRIVLSEKIDDLKGDISINSPGLFFLITTAGTQKLVVFQN